MGSLEIIHAISTNGKCAVFARASFWHVLIIHSFGHYFGRSFVSKWILLVFEKRVSVTKKDAHHNNRRARQWHLKVREIDAYKHRPKKPHNNFESNSAFGESNLEVIFPVQNAVLSKSKLPRFVCVRDWIANGKARTSSLLYRFVILSFFCSFAPFLVSIARFFRLRANKNIKTKWKKRTSKRVDEFAICTRLVETRSLFYGLNSSPIEQIYSSKLSNLFEHSFYGNFSSKINSNCARKKTQKWFVRCVKQSKSSGGKMRQCNFKR